MADIRIHREHALGLPKARKVAWQWAEDVEKNFDMQCTVIEGDFSDTIEFTRSGVKGTLIVAADHFDLNAKLGFPARCLQPHDRDRDREEPRQAAECRQRRGQRRRPPRARRASRLQPRLGPSSGVSCASRWASPCSSMK